MKRHIIILAALLLPLLVNAQSWTNRSYKPKWNPVDSLTYKVEMQGSFSSGKTPLWLNANKYGLSSLDEDNGYVRGSVYRPLSVDDERKFGLGYGVDVVDGCCAVSDGDAEHLSAVSIISIVDHVSTERPTCHLCYL